MFFIFYLLVCLTLAAILMGIGLTVEAAVMFTWGHFPRRDKKVNRQIDVEVRDLPDHFPEDWV